MAENVVWLIGKPWLVTRITCNIISFQIARDFQKFLKFFLPAAETAGHIKEFNLVNQMSDYNVYIHS